MINGSLHKGLIYFWQKESNVIYIKHVLCQIVFLEPFTKPFSAKERVQGSRGTTWHKANFMKMAMLPFCYFWINPLCKPLLIRTKLQSIEFAFNFWVWKGLETCEQVQVRLDRVCNLYQHETCHGSKWVFCQIQTFDSP